MSSDGILNLSEDELVLAKEKNTDKNKLVYALLLKYFQLEGHYPKHIKYIDPLMLNCIANQLNVSVSCLDEFDWEGRSTKRFRKEIRNLLGYKKSSEKDIDKLKAWLIKEIFPNGVKKSQLIDHAYEYFRQERVEPFTSSELERHVSSAHRIFEQKLFNSIHDKLSSDTKLVIDSLLIDEISKDEDESELENITEIKFQHLKQDIPGAKLKNVVFAIEKINYLQKLQLPKNLLSDLSIKLIDKYYTRVMAEIPSGLLDYKEHIKYATFSIFCYFRSMYLTDSLADLFTQLTHKMRTAAENSINKKILSEVRKVNGKFDILSSLASISIDNPAGIIEEKIYPTVSKETLVNIVKEHNSKGKWYENQVQKKMHSLYTYANRKMLLQLLDAFVFKSNSIEGNALLDAIKVIKEKRDLSDRYYPKDIPAPIKNVIPSQWMNLVVINDANTKKINRNNYEIAVLEELRLKLTCKTIWIEGAHRYRNPIDDLPKDFDERPEYYFKLVGLPLTAKEFTVPRKKKLHENLMTLNDTILTNKNVKITDKNGGRIRITPYAPQAESANIKKLHEAIKKEYGTINLIDILKEVELQIEFTEKLHTKASRKNLKKEVLRYRLLLCLYAIGTNVGLKCVSSANDDVQYSELRYVKRRFLTVENVRQAIVEVINKILEIRDPRIWDCK